MIYIAVPLGKPNAVGTGFFSSRFTCNFWEQAFRLDNFTIVRDSIIKRWQSWISLLSTFTPILEKIWGTFVFISYFFTKLGMRTASRIHALGPGHWPSTVVMYRLFVQPICYSHFLQLPYQFLDFWNCSLKLWFLRQEMLFEMMLHLSYLASSKLYQLNQSCSVYSA